MKSPPATSLTVHQWYISIVEALTETESETQVRFIDGNETRLPRDDTPERRVFHMCLTTSVRSRVPFAFVIGEGRTITQIACVTCEWIVAVSDQSSYADYATVEFGGALTPQHLSKQHPRYQEILRSLTHAANTQAAVWCIMEGNTIGEMVDRPVDIESMVRLESAALETSL